MAKRKTKPAKPYDSFPLSAASNGQWCKKVKGKIYYFGVWDDPQAALTKWLNTCDYLYAGIDPPKPDSGMSTRKLINTYLTRKKRRVAEGQESQVNFDDYKLLSKRMADWRFIDVPIDLLTPKAFADLRVFLQKPSENSKHGKERLSPATLNGRIRRISAIYSYGEKNFLFESSFRRIAGTEFQPPGRLELKRSEQQSSAKLFTPAEVKKMLLESSGLIQRAVYLGINCGFGAKDVSELRACHVSGDFVRMPRSKTLVDRAAWLWPETRKAILNASQDEVDYLCRANPDSDKKYSPLTSQFTRLKINCKCHRRGVGFYSLRHTFQTIADELEMPVTTRFIMGHADQSMSDHYRKGVSDENIRKVCEHVRKVILAK